MRALLALLVFCLASPALADYRPLGQAQAERFDALKKAWLALPVQLDLDTGVDQVRLRLPRSLISQTLTARLDFKRLPHYGDWIAKRQALGGGSWIALKALLDEVGDGPALALTHEALPATGEGSLLLGLRRGSQFDLYATVPGTFSACGQQLCFEPGTPTFASRSAALAWSLLKPLALAQAKAASSR